MNAKWSVLALFEDAAARQLAMEFCDSLVQRFWPELSFELSWYNWGDLQKPGGAKEAGLKVAEAQILIMATDPRRKILPEIKNWLELSLHARGDREGILIGLPVLGPGASCEAALNQQYLRKLAHQSGLDFLTSVPQSLRYGESESVEFLQTRATQVTRVLDKILHHSPTPPAML